MANESMSVNTAELNAGSGSAKSAASAVSDAVAVLGGINDPEGKFSGEISGVRNTLGGLPVLITGAVTAIVAFIQLYNQSQKAIEQSGNSLLAELRSIGRSRKNTFSRGYL